MWTQLCKLPCLPCIGLPMLHCKLKSSTYTCLNAMDCSELAAYLALDADFPGSGLAAYLPLFASLRSGLTLSKYFFFLQVRVASF